MQFRALEANQPQAEVNCLLSVLERVNSVQLLSELSLVAERVPFLL
jgi:hypothetical protein